MGLLTDEVRALIGQSRSFTAPEELGMASIRNFAIAIGDDNPVYAERGIAPPTLVCESNQYMTGEPDEHGYLGFTWDVPVPADARLVRGGNRYVFHQPVKASDVITATFTLVDADEKTTSSGAQLLIVSNEVRYTNQHGEPLVTNTESLIYTVSAS